MILRWGSGSTGTVEPGGHVAGHKTVLRDGSVSAVLGPEWTEFARKAVEAALPGVLKRMEAEARERERARVVCEGTLAEDY